MKETCEYVIEDVDLDTGKMKIVFANPFRTKTRVDNPKYQDHTRQVPIQMSGSNFDKEATDRVIEELSRGIYQKMLGAHGSEQKKKKAIEAAHNEYMTGEVENGE